MLPRLGGCYPKYTLEDGAQAIIGLDLVADFVQMVYYSFYAANFKFEPKNYLEGPDYRSDRDYSEAVVWSVMYAFHLLCDFLMIYGLIKKNHKFMVPWLILTLVEVIFEIIQMFTVDIAYVVESEFKDMASYSFFSIFMTCVNTYFFLVVRSYYLELTDSKDTAPRYEEGTNI